MNRREYLAGTSLFGVAATAGCLEWVFPDEDEDEDAEAGGDTQTDGAGDNRESDEDEQNAEDETESSEDGEEDTDEREDSNDDEDGEEKGETEEEDEEEELAPDREDVEPDRDEYDEPEEREVIERDSDDVSVDVSAQEEDGLTVISGSVTNVSDEFIDAVDLRFEFYDSEEGGEYVGGRLVSVAEIDPGEAASFEEEIWADELQGELARIELEAVEVFGFPDDDEDGDDNGA